VNGGEGSHVGEGVLEAALPPVGPVIERYGSANPWPGDRFAGEGK
jgi:hypothetical protein